MNTLLKDLQTALPGLRFLENEPLSRHCSFRIGGPAELLCLPSGAEELLALCRFFRDKGIQPFIMGNGTNLLFPDGSFTRPVIQCCDGVSTICVQENRITADCGATLAKVAAEALDHSLTGMEFAAGIPGSIGGAVSMDAGAYGGEMKDIVTRTEYLDENLRLCALAGEEHDFSYRHSAFSDTDWIIVRTELRLTPGSREDIAGLMRELAAKRRASQPLDKPSAGSTFKRPVGGYAAALIDQAGLKGFRIGGAQVSEKHAGFVINAGDATCEDVLRLMDAVRERVLQTSGIELEPEVKPILF